MNIGNPFLGPPRTYGSNGVSVRSGPGSTAISGDATGYGVSGNYGSQIRSSYAGGVTTEPKGDTIVQNEQGIYAFGIAEGAQAYFFHMVDAGSELPAKYLAAVEPDSVFRFASTCGKKEFVVGIQRGLGSWCMPDKTEEDRVRVMRNWNLINSGELLPNRLCQQT